MQKIFNSRNFKYLMIIFILPFTLSLFRNANKGWTEFARLNVAPEFIAIDHINKQATAIVQYRGKTYLIVQVDVARNTTQVRGSLRKLKGVIKPFTQKHYIEIIEEEARFLMADPETE